MEQDKMDIFKFIWWLIVMFLIGFISYHFLLKDIFEQRKIVDRGCEAESLFPCNPEVLLCFSNCRDLGLEYYKYDGGGFTSGECWCKINNETKQIW